MKLTKIASLILAIALVFSLGITAFAAETGSITINGASAGNTYTIYKLLDLESYNVTDGKYAYKVNSAWSSFFTTDAAKEYFTVDTQGYATWTNAKDDDDTVAAFAKLALAYAKANSIPSVASSNTPVDNKIVFSNLDLGYYLIDSTMGALCGLTTTNPHASINAKNSAPTIDKQVKEDSTDQWADANTADIGQVVEFRVTINVHEGAENYVFHDVMSAGLTFNGVSEIQHIIPGQDPHTATEVDDYEVKTAGITDGCTFEIIFSKDFCDHLETNDKVVIFYSAVVNENAIIAGEGNSNEAKLEFGENHFTTDDKTYSKTYAFDLVKTDSQNKLIDGAEFRIYDALTGGNEIKVVKISDELYRRDASVATGVNIVVKDGKVRIEGLDNGTYYLEEVVTPNGYNQLAARQKFIISDGNLDATFNGEIYSTGSGVHVVNKNGTMLPETGGIGTTLFYVVGGILVAGSLVFLVTKKRMGNR
ncbi:MAG: isopeptide-forming domain-containing fimbrial protein [Oscillospiraceae bacterium]|nr:isopeptide-forming domain-containing fimbrial protein [Oscillospiraceae bacterium]MBQ3501126.1 isopeptide-forming domain-containing fimbrial protein [Oscillospiraceae bacterium]MBQ4643851.1 isopeptide-forming domain-containing fimbrial protein [Oscillospiraceae bacterium]